MPSLQPEGDLLVGTNTRDDAGVLRLSAELALVSTVDLITPYTDDPFVYGQIAASNSLSDVYAMGGDPVGALNVCCFPDAGPAPEALARILEGGQERLQAAGARLLGGHTVKDSELKYGMAVQGVIHPDRIVCNHTPRVGDLLFLGKPLGSGIAMSLQRKGELSDDVWEGICRQLASLNMEACSCMLAHQVSAATDVTGFGFLGHLWEMLHPGSFGVELWLDQLPLYEGVREALGKMSLSGPMRKNLEVPAQDLGLRKMDRQLEDSALALLSDPQTSGGLLMAIPEANADAFQQDMQEKGQLCARVGRILEPGSASKIHGNPT